MTIIVAGVLAGCRDGVGPTPRTVLVNPYVATLEVDRGRIRDGGILSVYAVPQDRAFRLRDEEHVRVTARTSAGEAEDVFLEPAFCRSSEVEIYYCHAMAIVMHDRVQITEIEPALNRINVRLTLVVPSGLAGGAWDFSGHLEAAMRRIKSWPSVKSVERNAVAFLQGLNEDIWGTMSGALPLDNVPPVPHDRHLQLRPGDTLIVSYAQPDKTLLSDTVITSNR